ncbi:hypothetical protein ACHAWF_010419, partial [Thalassiosira exigua]
KGGSGGSGSSKGGKGCGKYGYYGPGKAPTASPKIGAGSSEPPAIVPLSTEDKPIKVTDEEAADVKPNSGQVRDSCLKAFELGFPEQGWASESSLEDFAANMAPSAFFASPMGGGEGAEMQGFAEGDL